MYCVYGASKSMNAFCVNDGICKEIMTLDNERNSNKHFKGCDCPDMYTGLHCEISIGQLSAFSSKSHDGVAYSRASSSTSNDVYYTTGKSTNQTNARFITVYVTLVAFAVIIVLTVIIRNIVEIKRNREIRIESAVDRDLHIEADGAELREQMEKDDELDDRTTEGSFT